MQIQHNICRQDHQKTSQFFPGVQPGQDSKLSVGTWLSIQVTTELFHRSKPVGISVIPSSLSRYLEWSFRDFIYLFHIWTEKYFFFCLHRVYVNTLWKRIFIMFHTKTISIYPEKSNHLPLLLYICDFSTSPSTYHLFFLLSYENLLFFHF